MSLHCKACSSTFFPEEIEDTDLMHSSKGTRRVSDDSIYGM